MSRPNKLYTVLWIIVFSSTYIYGPAAAGTLEFDGIPVDITTAENEDLVIVPGTGGNIQIGDAAGANSNASTNDDLYVTGVLETDGAIYADGGLVAGSNIIPGVDLTYNLGSSAKYWNNLYVTSIFAGDLPKIKNVSYSWPAAQGGVGTVLTNDGVGGLSWGVGGGGGAALPTVDTTSIVEGSVDPTKEARFEVDGLTTATVRTLTIQDVDGTVYVSGGTDIPITDGGTGASDDATARANLNVEIGVDVQAYDADLTTWGGKTAPTGAVVGTTDVQTLTNKTLEDATTTFVDELDITKALKLELANITTATTRTLTVPDADGTLAVSATSPLALSVAGNMSLGTVPMNLGGTGASLADPNADRIFFWDDSLGATTFLDLGTNLSITGTTLNATAGSSLPVVDTTEIVTGSVDNTKRMKFEVDGLTTATVRTLTIQDVDGTVYVSGGTDVAIADGGTGASDDATARANLNVEIGVDVQAYDADLTTWGGKTAPTGAVVGTTDVQTLTNKTLEDATTTFVDELDITKALKLQLSGITTASTRTLTVPDADGTFAVAATSPITLSAAGAIGIGNIPVTNLDSGTNASSSTFWRGDGAWSAPPPATSLKLNGLTDADGTNALANGVHAQTWNWDLAATNNTGMTLGETTAATAGGTVLKASTLATSTATPLMVTNLGAGTSLRVNDETGDTDATPFIIDASGNVGIGAATPTAKLDVRGSVYLLPQSTADVIQLENSSIQTTKIKLFTNTTSLNNSHVEFQNNNGNRVYRSAFDSDQNIFVEKFDTAYPIVTGLLSNSALAWTIGTGVSNTTSALTTEYLRMTTTTGAESLSFPGTNVGIGNIDPATKLDLTGALTVREMTAPAAAPADQGRIYFDSVTNKFKVSESTGGYVDLISPAGSSLPVVDTTSIVEGSADDTKEVRFEVDGLTTGTVRTLTIQDVDGTVYVSGGTDVAVADGGTGASDDATARDNLNVEIGVDVQAYDADLTTWAGKTAPSGTVVGTSDTQTLTNKSLSDSTTWVIDNTDATKRLNIDVTGTTGITGILQTQFTTAKTVIIPDAAGTVAVSATTPVTLSATGDVGVSDFVASGAGHARGAVPDPGVTAGTTKFLREDATWATVAGGDVTGPSSSVDNSLVRFDGTTGKTIQGYTSGAPTVADTGALTMNANILLNGNYVSGDGGNEGLFVDTTGQVGVGTPTPGDLFDVQGGSIRNSALAGVSNRCVYADTNGVLRVKTDDCGLAGAAGDDLGNHTAAQNILLGSNWLTSDGDNEGLRVGTTGNVGIGTSTLTSGRLVVDGGNLTFGTDNTFDIGATADNRPRAGYFGTSLLSPVLYGSSAADGDITIEGTSHATKTTSYVNLQPTGGNVGIGNTDPATAFDLSGALSVREMSVPATSGLNRGRIYFDSTADKFRVSENNGAYVDLVNTTTYAPTNASYITQVTEVGLSGEQALGALASGLLKNTTTTGVLSIATAGADYYNPGGTDVALADGGTGASLVDPNADRILFWDDSAGASTWLDLGTNLSISNTTLNASLTEIGDISAVGDVLSGAAFTATAGADGNQLFFEGSTANGNEVLLTAADPGADVTVTIPAVTGTLYITGGTDVAVADGGTGASDDATARDNLNVEIGVDVQAYDADLTTWAGKTAPSGTVVGTSDTQTLTNKSLSDSTTWVIDNTDATKRLNIDVTGTTGITGILQTQFTTAKTVIIPDVSGTIYVTGGTDVALADGGTGASLVDPNADRILFWDDSAGASTWLDLGTNLSISNTTLNASLTEIGDISAVGDVLSGAAFTATAGADGNQLFFEGSTANGNEVLLTAADPGADVTVTIPAVTGTLYITGGTDVAVADGGTGASDDATARDNLNVEIGVDVQAYDADLTTWAGKTAPSGTVVGTSDTQTLTNKSLSDSTTWVIDNTDATKRLNIDVTGTTGITGILQTQFTTAKTVIIPDVSGTIYVTGGTDVALADGGTGASLVDPNADRILFWDDSAGASTWLDLGTNLSISNTTLNASLTEIGDISAVGDVLSGAAFTATAGADGNQLFFEGSTANGNEVLLTAADPGADVTVTIPAVTGTLYITGGTDVAVADGGTGASDDATARDNLNVEIGVDVQAYDADLTTWAGKTAPSGTVVGTSDTQTLTNKSLSDSTTWVIDNTDATKRLNIDVTGTTGITGILQTQFTTAKTVIIPDVSGTIYVTGGTDVALADGGTGASLVDPNADRILFWDDSAGASTWLDLGTNLSISNTTLNASLTEIGDISAVGDVLSGAAFTATAGADGNQLFFEGSTANGNEVLLTAADPGADVTVTIPAVTGTLYITGGTDVAVADGGTGASDDATARDNLNVEIGVDVQAYDPDLDTWASKAAPSGVVVGTNDVQLLSSKSFEDSTTSFVDQGDLSKILKFEVAGITTGTTRTWNIQDADGTVYVSGGQDVAVADGGTGTSTAFTQGSVVFAGASGVYSQDNTNLFWDNTGKRLGIGGTPTTYPLEVIKNQNASTYASTINTTNGTLSLAGYAMGSADASLFIAAVPSAYTGGGSLSHLADRALISAYTDTTGLDLTSSAATGDMRFYTGGLATTNERMRIEADGDVGIGTIPAAGYRLQVKQDQNGSTIMSVDNATDGTAAVSALRAASATSTVSLSAVSGSYSLAHLADRGLLQASTNATGLDIMAAAAAGDMRFYTGGSTTTEERMRLENDGDLGIGVTPTSKLDLSGAFTFREMSAPANAPANQGRIYFDSGADKFKISENNTGYVDLVPSGGVGPADATYITKTTHAGLSNEQAIGALATGLMQVTTTSGDITSVTTSAGVAGVISDEVGSSGGGVIVFNNAPTITSPVIKGEAVVALTGAANIATNASLGNIFTIEYNAAATLDPPTNPTSGQKCIWRFKNTHGSSAFTLTLSTAANGFRFGTTVQGTSATPAGKIDYIGAIWNATDSKWDVIAYAKGYV